MYNSGLMKLAEKRVKQAFGLSEHVGPYEADRAADIAAADDRIAGARRNWNEDYNHAIFNPFVSGPVSEWYNRLKRRNAAGKGSNMAGAVIGNTIDLAANNPYLGGPIPSWIFDAFAGDSVARGRGRGRYDESELRNIQDEIERADQQEALSKVSSEVLSGGLGDNKPVSAFNSKQLAKGISTEKEHTNRPDIAAEIAKDHLTEDPMYYSKLERMEEKQAVDAQDIMNNPEGDIGPYRSTMGAHLSALDRSIAANIYNRRHNFGHYLLNPFVRGPMFEGMNRLRRRITASMGTSTPMAIAGEIPGVNLLAYPYLAYEGGAERQNALREAFNISPSIERAREAEGKSEEKYLNRRLGNKSNNNVKTSAYLGQLAAEITKDHLAEDSNYYTKLQKLAWGTGEHVGPYEAERAADVMYMDDVVATSRRNQDTHPGHATINPFVLGMTTEPVGRMLRRNAANRGASIGSAIFGEAMSGIDDSALIGDAISSAFGKRQNVPTARERYKPIQTVQDELENRDRASIVNPSITKDDVLEDGDLGPFRASMGAHLAGLDRAIATNVYNRRNNFGHYLLNPFVGGPISELVNRGTRRSTASMGTSKGMGITGSIPFVGGLATPYLMYHGGKERQMALRDAYRASPTIQDAKKDEQQREERELARVKEKEDKKKEKNDNVKTSAYLGQLAAQRSYLNR